MEINRNIALLIDAENISSKYIELIVDEANKEGKINYRRVYGDWTTDHLKPWKAQCIEYGLTPVQQYSYTYGKNASDFTLIIDAMDILYGGKVDSFCIVTSDSDFTKLVTRLKEDNMFVFGMGESKTPEALVKACESFIYLDKLLEMQKKIEEPEKIEVEPVKDKKSSTKKEKSSITPLAKIITDMVKIIEDNLEDDGWAYWSLVAQLLQKKYPGFHPRNYGKNTRPILFFEGRNEFSWRKEGTSVYIQNKKS